LGLIEPAGDLLMASFFTRLIKDEAGVTAIEYGLIAALIVIGSLVAVNSVSLNLNLQNTFSTVAANL
jgi:pilus assembly protein Flp/PilA